MARSEFWVWAGSVGVALSAVLGIVAVFFPFSWLIITGLVLGGVSAPFAIISARYQGFRPLAPLPIKNGTKYIHLFTEKMSLTQAVYAE